MYKVDYGVFLDESMQYMTRAICQKCGGSWKPRAGKFPKYCRWCASQTWTQPRR
jgi:predicted Zn-ribbon and HTH transcriptional regulator